MTEAIIAGSTLAITTAWWRWANMDKQTIARRLALRLLAYAEGLDARDKAVDDAMKKTIVLMEGNGS